MSSKMFWLEKRHLSRARLWRLTTVAIITLIITPLANSYQYETYHEDISVDIPMGMCGASYYDFNEYYWGGEWAEEGEAGQLVFKSAADDMFTPKITSGPKISETKSCNTTNSVTIEITGDPCDFAYYFPDGMTADIYYGGYDDEYPPDITVTITEVGSYTEEGIRYDEGTIVHLYGRAVDSQGRSSNMDFGLKVTFAFDVNTSGPKILDSTA